MDQNKEHFIHQTYCHTMTLLKEPRRVANYVQYKIGILLETIASHNQLGLADLQMKLCVTMQAPKSLLIT